ncbi:oxygen-insensitive NAD(P)H nitroreductase [Thiomicrorhabdus sp. 6S2-11]|uniref:Oxygen-insensitive NAD(P)H nitroreductase n=1 Tax=Thiomicrorhabdus marina TaxID=2818442 RepID=A0ABS3Q292_9GAMM|nr:oxygen-insensitive NAD(P)H nitroreductase [Thiomicrorhabdus marina]MBO1925960.1 oxygen-insensitive NAD(P)H nitroreductase [Thiomicrorhabdus marina]
MNIVEIAKNRYATKKFAADKIISCSDFEQIKQLLRFSPSSINSQPWHFIIADNQAGKARIAKGAQTPYNANEPKIMDASHVILFCAKTEISDDYLLKVTEQEAQDGRFANLEGKEMAMKVRRFYADLHRKDWDDVECWTQKQVYLNIGTILLGAGALRIDAVPIEGVDLDKLDQEFSLLEKGLKAVAVVALGYHAEDDFNATLPKSRFAENDVITVL